MTYSYDGLGRRVKIVEAGTTYLVYSGLSLVHTVAGATVTSYVYASGLLVARTEGGVTSYLHQDALGSIRAVTDGSGNWVWRAQYKPLGQEYGTSGTEPKLKYTGQWRDTNTGLYYPYRRFFDPDLGRFRSPDPILGHLIRPPDAQPVPVRREQPAPVRRPHGGVGVELVHMVGTDLIRRPRPCRDARSRREERAAPPTTSQSSYPPRARPRGDPDPP